jgi:5,10-methylenetetrahydrofolate reductase
MKQIALGFQLIAPDVRFIKNRMINNALAKEITPGQARVTELKVQRVMGRETIKGVKPAKLLERNDLVDVRAHIEDRFPKVDIDTVNDSIDKPFEFCHELLLLR